MDLEHLHKIVRETTAMFRKGPTETTRVVGPIEVVEIYAMPHVDDAPATLDLIDVGPMVVGVDRAKALARKAELVALLKEYPVGELERGPSYITVGGHIGSQDAALCLFALGEVLNVWRLMTPARLGATPGSDLEKQAIGAGFVMIDGFRP